MTAADDEQKAKAVAKRARKAAILLASNLSPQSIESRAYVEREFKFPRALPIAPTHEYKRAKQRRDESGKAWRNV